MANFALIMPNPGTFGVSQPDHRQHGFIPHTPHATFSSPHYTGDRSILHTHPVGCKRKIVKQKEEQEGRETDRRRTMRGSEKAKEEQGLPQFDLHCF